MRNYRQFLSAAVLGSGILIIVALLALSHPGTPRPLAASAPSPQWTQRVGLGQAVSACVSSGPTATCNEDGTATIAISWDASSRNNSHPGCTSTTIQYYVGVPYEGEPTATSAGGDCVYTYIWPTALANTTYTYIVGYYANGYNADRGDYVDSLVGSDSGTVTTPNCAPPPPPQSPPPPTAILSANPSTIDSGQSSSLFWSSTDATSCTSAGGFSTGGATANPSGGVSTGALTQTSTYQLTCSGPGGTSDPAQATVTVLTPSATITVNPPRVNLGGGGGGGGGSAAVTVSWTGTNVNSCTVTRNGVTWQSLVANGSRTVNGSAGDTVTAQTAYAITCTNNAGPTQSVSTVVNVTSGFREF